MNWNQAIKKRVGNKKYPVKTRIKVGRGIVAWALFPGTLSLWMLPIGVMMSLTITPSLWTKDKIRYFKEWRSLK